MTQEGEKGTAVSVEGFYGETQRQGPVLFILFFFFLICGCALKEKSIGLVLQAER